MNQTIHIEVIQSTYFFWTPFFMSITVLKNFTFTIRLENHDLGRSMLCCGLSLL